MRSKVRVRVNGLTAVEETVVTVVVIAAGEIVIVVG